MAFWRTIGIKRESTTMCERFVGIGWSGTEVTVMPGQATASRRHFDDSFLDLGEIAPGLVLGGIAVYLTSKAVRAQLRHLNKTRIVIAAHPSPDATQTSTELWCFPWDTAIQRAHPGKDPFARVFEYLHTSLHHRASCWLPRASSKKGASRRLSPLRRGHRDDAPGRTQGDRHQRLPLPTIRTPMTPLFSRVGRSLSLTTHPFRVFRLAVSPDEAVARCVAQLHKDGIRAETPGMREQFALRGWVGTELATGNTGKAFLVDAIASATTTGIVADLFPRAVPDRVKRAFLEKTRIEVIARPIPGGMRPMSELWCHFDYTSTGETMFAEDCIASMLERIEQSFRDEGLMIAAPERLRIRDMPPNVPLALLTLMEMRRAAKRARRGR